MLLDWFLLVALLLAALGWTFAKGASVPAKLFLAPLILAAFSGAFLWQKHLQSKLASQASLIAPHLGRPDEYAGSASCRACHPDQYASWHRSFHRTMTQLAAPDSIRGDFDDVHLSLDGDDYQLQRRGEEFWVQMPDPDYRLQHETATNSLSIPSNAPQVWRRVSMVTGSHQMQAYWLDNAHGNQQFSFPFTYLFEQQRWVPRRSVFIRDPSVLPWKQVWNIGCVDCHSTAGQPWRAKDHLSFDTRVAELGISCESCHGPAAEHVRENSNPLRRYALHLRARPDASIVNPTRLSHQRSSQICGRCHSVHEPRDEQDWLLHGESFHAGEDLESKLEILRQRDWELRPKTSWSDGMVRVSGREYNGLSSSACYLKGEMSCLSCHSMHESSPTNQLAAGMDGNQACLQCHQSMAKNIAAHTHHAADSSGSLCYNCHMPYTSYGLVRGIRSHQISSPDIKTSLDTGRPDACNLCHLDKTLDWAAQNLSAWYQIPVPQMPEGYKMVAASIIWTLKGDAGLRALMAWHMGWKPATDISGRSWQAPFLATLLDDPYPAVRCVAQRSLKRLPGFENFSYDYVAPNDSLPQARARAAELWERGPKPSTNSALLIGADGALDRRMFNSLLKLRDGKTMVLGE